LEVATMSAREDAPIRICFDRSDGARRAIDQAAELFSLTPGGDMVEVPADVASRSEALT
jgi:hypothetical protein